MSRTSKISISIADPALLAWAKERAARDGTSLSALFTEAVRLERQLEARRELLASWPERPALEPEDRAAIRAEWEGGPRYEPQVVERKPKKPTPKLKKRRAA